MVDRSPEATDAEPSTDSVASPTNGSVAEASAATEGAPRSSHGEPSEALRRTSSKIANLRAAFENKNGAPSHQEIPKRRFERSSSSNQNQDAEMARLKEQVETVTKLAEQQELEIKKLKEQLEAEINSRRTAEDQIKTHEALLAKKDNDWQATLDGHTSAFSTEKSNLQEDASKMQQQLLELKRTIATNTRVDSQVSDATIVEQMQFLHHESQNWIVAHFRKAEKSPEEMRTKLESLEEPGLLPLKPVFDRATYATRLSALQAVMVHYLLEIFQEPLFFGLPSQHRHVKKCAETLPSILPPETFNRWRSVTADVIRQSETVSEYVESASRSMSDIICITLNALTGVEESQSRVTALNTIVKKAISLAHTCKVQRAQYVFELPSAGQEFLPSSMEDTAADNEAPAPASRSVLCATFPSVKKLGDEGGGNMQMSSIVMKAKVLCG